jgi:superfamily II DNA or RNA helicase
MCFAYLYFRENELTILHSVIKCGITLSYVHRNNGYTCYEIHRGKYIKIIRVSANIILQLDKTIKDHFKHLNIRFDAGTEYYQKNMVDNIESFLELLNVKFTVLSDDELLNIEYKCELMYKLQQINKRRLIDCLVYSNHNVIPYDFQCKVLSKLFYYFQKNNCGKIIWSCGLGKTILAILSINVLKAKTVVIGVPTKFLQTQMLQTILLMYNRKDNILLVGGKNKNGVISTTNQDKIVKFNNKITNDVKIIITTYKSCHLLKNNFIYDYKIADEAHHLTGIKNSNENSNLAFHDIKSKKQLYMTATEKTIIGDNVYSMNDLTFGKYIDQKSVYWAIENKKITDYNILLIRNTVQEVNNIIEMLDIQVSNKELFISAFITLKSIEKYDDLTHVVLYTNSVDNAILVEEYINQILEHNILNIDGIYNKALHSDTKECLENEVNMFKNAKIGIISCIYIFGEGFDLPKLNGACFCENMYSDIRIVQCALRPNRLEYNNLNKIAYIIIPYIDTGLWTDESNSSFKKCRTIISKIRNVDETIEHKIKMNSVSIKSCNKTSVEYDKNTFELTDNVEELHKLKLRLRHSKDLNSNLSMDQNEYNYVQNLNKSYKLLSKDEYFSKYTDHEFYIHNPEEHYCVKGLWKDWYHFLGVDVSNFFQCLEEWKEYCKSENITTLEEYKLKCCCNNKLPINPGDFYVGFTSVVNELSIIKKRR